MNLMKKIMFAALMMFATSTAFAADSDALKSILKSKNYAEAAAMLQSSVSQLASDAERANLKTWLACRRARPTK